jgi:hypothetical protein
MADDMSDLEIKFLRRLMAQDAVIWASHSGHKLLGGRETAQVLAEWRAEQRGLTAGSSQAA